MSIYIIEIAQTASSGAWSFNSLSIVSGVCKEIYDYFDPDNSFECVVANT